jgi:3-hydroxyisobutyrate dehydrogenase-like beta-hydroxyacid dehydrogenase
MMHDGKHDPLFMIQHMSKDTKLCSYLAKSIKQESKIINATSDLYQSAVSQGLGENNWTGVHTSISNVPSTLSYDD